MDYTTHEPNSPGATPRPSSTPHSAPVAWLKSEPATNQPDVEPNNPLNLPLRTTRHDGWTGEKMAVFCETLAETAVVAEACDAAPMGFPAPPPRGAATAPGAPRHCEHCEHSRLCCDAL